MLKPSSPRKRGYKYSKASKKQLATAHPALQEIFTKVLEYWDHTVLEGKRSEAAQRINVATGASKTMQSKHVYPIEGTSLAVDAAPYPIKWSDLSRFYAFAGFVIGTATALGYEVRWGGDWDSDRDLSDQSFNDLVHFELVMR